MFLVGVDGATWKVADPMIERGELPILSALLSRGCHGTMKSLRPSKSPRIWTSVASGVAPETHGIVSFTYPLHGKRHLYTSDMVKVPRLWDIASAHGVQVGVTNYWFTYPASPVQGFIISDHVIPSRSDRVIRVFSRGESPPPNPEKLVYPEELWARVAPVLDRPSL